MEWQPIETAPKDDQEVILFVNGQVDIGYRFFFGNNEYICLRDEPRNCQDCSPVSRKATHWMPLPEDPLTTDSKGK